MSARKSTLDKNKSNTKNKPDSSRPAIFIPKKIVSVDKQDEGEAPFDPSLQFLLAGSGEKTQQDFKADETIFSQGDVGNAVFFIQSGRVKLAVVSKTGKEAVIAVLPEGSFFGEGCLVGQLHQMFTATAVEQSTVIRLGREVVLTLLREDPEFAGRFLAYLLSRNIRMEADLVDHLFNSSEQRLARLLLLMANFGQPSEPMPLLAKMSQETLANMIGTTRSRVSFFLNRFKELGFIEYEASGRMQVHRSLISIVLHNE